MGEGLDGSDMARGVDGVYGRGGGVDIKTTIKSVRMSEYLWKKEEAVAEACGRPEIVKRVLVMYTGGTIGMKWSKEMGE